MKRYYFSGVIHPERAALTVQEVGFKIGKLDGNSCLTLKFSIVCNQITCIVECDSDDEDIFSLRNLVKSSIETVISLLGFLKGYAYDIEITKVFDEECSFCWVFGIDLPSVENIYSSFNKDIEKLNEAINSIGHLCLMKEGIYIARCLNDLRMSMRYLDDSAFYCFRAIETIKQYFGDIMGTEKDGEQWLAMRNAIGGEKEYLDFVRKLAFPARHGVPTIITDEDRGKIFTITWSVVERFINYRLEQLSFSFRLSSDTSM
ncbi:MAG: invasion associated locus B family protein [Fischerella sp. CENA71]|nr:invasion associated locus B family protein [Fischerella sp. CENA71]